VQLNKSDRGRPPRRLVYQRLSEAVEELDQRLGGLPTPNDAQAIWTSIWHLEAHHSTALEGNTLVIAQVETLLAEGRAVGDRELSEYLEVTGYATAAQWVYGHALDPGDWTSGSMLSLTEVRHIHELALGPVWGVAPHPNAGDREGPGSFRRHDLHRFPGGMQPPPWTEVEAAMVDWMNSLESISDTERLVEAVAAAHGAFEKIHPFIDGNGRTGRLILNLLLMRGGLPPALIFTRQRSKYLQALQRCDQGDPGPLGEIVARAVLDNLYRFVYPAVAGPDSLIPLVALVSKHVTVTSLRAAAERGRLRAQKGADGQWRSTKEWVHEYRSSRYSRGSGEPLTSDSESRPD